MRGYWIGGYLRFSASFVLSVPRDDSLPGYTPELLVGTCGKAGQLSVAASNQGRCVDSSSLPACHY